MGNCWPRALVQLSRGKVDADRRSDDNINKNFTNIEWIVDCIIEWS